METFIDGSKFKGSFSNGLKHGSGKFTWEDGSSYEGAFNINLIQGYGYIIISYSSKYYWPDGK